MRSRARELLAGHAAQIAPLLLDARLISRVDGHRVALRITEVEAYGGVGEDPGSHAFRRQTTRNSTMFGAPGFAYVYFTYGMHWCLNVVTGAPGAAGAVLVRAGEVIDGTEVARSRRRAARRDADLARGPARLAAALGITGEHDGIDLLAPGSILALRLARASAPEFSIGPRTGVSGAGAITPWRFALDHPTVSPYRPARPRTRG